MVFYEQLMGVDRGCIVTLCSPFWFAGENEQPLPAFNHFCAELASSEMYVVEIVVIIFFFISKKQNKKKQKAKMFNFVVLTFN